jgi:hypothetical protein
MLHSSEYRTSPAIDNTVCPGEELMFESISYLFILIQYAGV